MLRRITGSVVCSHEGVVLAEAVQATTDPLVVVLTPQVKSPVVGSELGNLLPYVDLAEQVAVVRFRDVDTN